MKPQNVSGHAFQALLRRPRVNSIVSVTCTDLSLAVLNG